MDGKNYFLKKKRTSILVALLVAISGGLLLAFEQNAYPISRSEATTTRMNKTITISENGDVRFQEDLQRYFSTQVFYQDIYFTSDHEDVPKSVATPAFDATRFQSTIYSEANEVMIQSLGQEVESTFRGHDLKLSYSWLANGTDEIGRPIEPIDDESVTWFHYHSGTWGNIRIENDYWMNGVALKYADTAEFFWVVAATDNMLTEQVDVKIILPGNPSEAEVKAYVMGASQAMIHHIGLNDDNQMYVHIKANRLFPGEFISTRINFPASYLSIDATQDQLYGNDVSDRSIANGQPHLTNIATYQAAYQQMRTRYLITDVLAISILIGLVIFAIIQTRKIYLKYDKEHPTDFYGEYYRELPAAYEPALMGYLYRFKEVNKDDVTATLMDLIRRKFILLDTGTESLTASKVNYVMKLNPAMDRKVLAPHEQQLIQWFFTLVGGGDTLTLNQLEAFTKKESQAIRYLKENQAFNQSVFATAKTYDFFDLVNVPAQKSAWFVGLLGLVGILSYGSRLFLTLGTWTGVVGGLLLGGALLLQAYVSSIERRSKQGNEDYVRWRAFEKFLKEFTNIKDYPMPGLTIWEHYMVYATAFGIADLVEKQVRFKYQQMNQTEALNRSPFFRYPGFYGYYYLSLNRSFMSARSTIAQAQAQRNNSGRGGGRFGGGGGFRTGGGGSGIRIR